jgi:transglutaminase-like putative cysteine protease
MTATQVPPVPAPSGVLATAAGSPGAAGSASPGRLGRPAASAALMIFTLCSALGLLRIFVDDSWTIPVAVTIVIVSLTSWARRALRVAAVPSIVMVVVAIALSVAWTALGSYTFYGLPTATTWDHFSSALANVGPNIASMLVPVKLTTGFEILAVGLAAVAAALADWLAFGARIPLAGLVPGLAVFVVCCAVGAPTYRPQVVGFEVAGACLYLLIERTTAPDDGAWFARVSPRVTSGTVVGGAVLAAVAVMAALALSPALAPRDGAGVLGFRNGSGSGGGERIVPNPLVDLRTRLTQLGNSPVFVAGSSQPSYWRLTSLDTFNGVTWTSSGSYRGFDTQLPGSAPAQAATRKVSAQFTIQQLDSPWMPAQFTPVAERGGKQVSYDAASNSLLTAARTSNSLNYSVTSVEYLDTLTAAQLASAPPIDRNGSARADLNLPSGINPEVLALAVSITAAAPTEYAKALALQNYLRSPLFRYTLSPPTDGSGTDALTTFLEVTRQGYCQQFAGAYAVLARAVGLPTRLAVGFVTGTAIQGGRYQVYDHDAHTWPEVYFGPRYGWVPFEPTPGFSIPGAAAYTQINDAQSGPDGPGTATTTTIPSTAPTTSNSSSNVTRRLGGPTTVASSAAPGLPHGSGSGGGLWLLVIPGAVVLWIAANALLPVAGRERRRRRAITAGTAAAVAQEWDEVGRELARYGLRRLPSETDDEYARRAEAGLATVTALPARVAWQHGGLAELAALSRRASFAADVPADLAQAAATTGAEIRNRLYAALTFKERVMRWTSPAPGAVADLRRRLRR